MSRALVIGEALIDVVKSPTGTTSEHVGGSPANVALALARLGHPVDLLTWLAYDIYGDYIRRHLKANQVHLLGESVSAYSTPVAIARTQTDGRVDYEFDVTWDLPQADTITATPLVVHTGSLATAVQPGANKVAALIQRLHGSATVTYDPNIRPSLMGDRLRMRPVVAHYLATADIVKASEEDLRFLEPGLKPEFTIANWARQGPALAVLTKGAAGITALTSSGDRIDLPAYPVTVADTVGAGDSFMGALIDGLWRANLLGGTNRQALRDSGGEVFGPLLERAVVAAGLTCAHPGAHTPSSQDLQAAGAGPHRPAPTAADLHLD